MVAETDASGANDLVYVTALAQCLLLNLNESPFFATSGIPAVPSVVQQVAPDYYVALTQQQYAPYFASLLVSRNTKSIDPRYEITVVTHQGVKINATVPIPT